jgi:hypothetical protein
MLPSIATFRGHILTLFTRHPQLPALLYSPSSCIKPQCTDNNHGYESQLRASSHIDSGRHVLLRFNDTSVDNGQLYRSTPLCKIRSLSPSYQFLSKRISPADQQKVTYTCYYFLALADHERGLGPAQSLAVSIAYYCASRRA